LSPAEARTCTALVKPDPSNGAPRASPMARPSKQPLNLDWSRPDLGDKELAIRKDSFLRYLFYTVKDSWFFLKIFNWILSVYDNFDKR
jgi:hypothetical protein